MKAKEVADKNESKMRFATALDKAISDLNFNSHREFALSGGFEPSHIQKIAAGKVDVSLTTIISLAEGLGITFAKFADYYDLITPRDVETYKLTLKNRKRTPSKAKKIPSKKTKN